MTTAPSNPSGATPAWKPLAPNQRRVLGVLIEKAKTTPAGYPMTVNAIVAGCNQKNNRDPVMSLDDIDVSNTLVELERLGAVSEVDWVGRVPKYKHRAYEWLGVERVELAVMGELLLRGAQSMGDLRGRAARMEPIADLAALKPIVEGLIARKLMIEISAPGRGQMVSHNLYSEPERAELSARTSGLPTRVATLDEVPASPGPARPVPAPVAAPVAATDRIAELSAEVRELRATVDRLSQRIRELEARLE